MLLPRRIFSLPHCSPLPHFSFLLTFLKLPFLLLFLLLLLALLFLLFPSLFRILSPSPSRKYFLRFCIPFTFFYPLTFIPVLNLSFSSSSSSLLFVSTNPFVVRVTRPILSPTYVQRVPRIFEIAFDHHGITITFVRRYDARCLREVALVSYPISSKVIR